MRHSNSIERIQIIKLIIYLGIIFLMIWADFTNQLRLGEFMKFSNYNPLGPGNYATVTLDSDGVPFVVYNDPQIGMQYNPTTIAQWGLAEFSRYIKTSDKKYLVSATKSGDWLLRNQLLDGTWANNFVIDRQINGYQPLKAPWVSAITQGNAISLLARLYQETNLTTYLKAAQQALLIFEIPISGGGIRVDINNSEAWFEEWTHTEGALYTLNGHLFALVGLYDLYQAYGDPIAKKHFDSGELAVRHLILDFNVKNSLPATHIKTILNWSTYDLQHKILTNSPPKLGVTLLFD